MLVSSWRHYRHNSRKSPRSRAKAEVVGLRQRGRPVIDYIREFQQVAGKLRSWPERHLVHHFRAGLDGALHRACICGIPSRLQDWFLVTVELDVGLQEFRGRTENLTGFWRSSEKAKEEGQKTLTVTPRPSSPATWSLIRCFCCDQPGHRVAECPVPVPQAVPTTPGTCSITPRKPVKRTQAAHQQVGEMPRQPSQMGVETPMAAGPQPMIYNSMDELNEDPMVEPW
ncbi:uncharacterized protein M6D78_001968 [Vipera latastei]